jgi:AcrR family transcriptional regulator
LNVVRLSVVPTDRRERSREQRRARYLAAASRIIDRDGVAGITMQSLAEEMDCAVGTVYTYFPSKAALVAALAQQAIEVLHASYVSARHTWDAYLESEGVEEQLAALIRLLAYAAYFSAASVVLADEFALQQALLSDPVASDPTDRSRPSLAVVRALLETPRGLVEAGVEAEVLQGGDGLERALRWLAALNGVLRVDVLAPLDRHLFRGTHLARALTEDLLVGWGASREDVEVAGTQVERLAALGPMAPPPE